MALLILSVGMHWIFLQSVAWVGMVVTYAQHDSLPLALSKTFDGKHPCKLCKVVAKGQQAEHQQAPVEKLKKQGLESYQPAPASVALLAPRFEPFLFREPAAGVSRPHAPPSPPPRFA